MRRVKLLALIAVVLGALVVAAGPASAQADPTYAGTPGSSPIAGPNDTGTPSGDSGTPTQVLGQRFQRSGSGTGTGRGTGGGSTEPDFLASTGGDILELTAFGLAIVGVGIVLVRRARRRTPLAA